LTLPNPATLSLSEIPNPEISVKNPKIKSQISVKKTQKSTNRETGNNKPQGPYSLGRIVF
jgi:hypothetical protein